MTSNSRDDEILERIKGMTMDEIEKLDIDFGDSYPVMQDGRCVDILAGDYLGIRYRIFDDAAFKYVYAIKRKMLDVWLSDLVDDDERGCPKCGALVDGPVEYPEDIDDGDELYEWFTCGECGYEFEWWL